MKKIEYFAVLTFKSGKTKKLKNVSGELEDLQYIADCYDNVRKIEAYKKEQGFGAEYISQYIAR
jgi:hypothetical protein